MSIVILFMVESRGKKKKNCLKICDSDWSYRNLVPVALWLDPLRFLFLSLLLFFDGEVEEYVGIGSHDVIIKKAPR